MNVLHDKKISKDSPYLLDNTVYKKMRKVKKKGSKLSNTFLFINLKSLLNKPLTFDLITKIKLQTVIRWSKNENIQLL